MATSLAADLSSVDAVETTPRPGRAPLRRVWAGLWPKLAAAALLLAVWQAVVWSGWKPDYVAVRRQADLQPPRPGDGELVVLAAARLGRTRLIDNVEVFLR